MNRFKREFLTGPYIVWIIGFIVLPILMIVYYGVTDSSNSFTLANIIAIAEPIHMKACTGLYCDLPAALLSAGYDLKQYKI